MIFIFIFSSLINNSKNCRDKNTDLDNVLAEEIGQDSIRPRLPSFTAPTDSTNENSEVKQPFSLPGSNPNLMSDNRFGWVKDNVFANKSISTIPPTAMENAMISEQNISIQPQPVIVRKELSTLPLDHSPVTLPGRCELSVTPLIKV